MAYETAASVNLAELNAGQLVDTLGVSVKALTGIDGAGEYGGITTLDNVSSPSNFDDIGAYAPGIDAVQDINPTETLANRRVVANKGRGDERPRMYHTVVEYGDRYRSATGKHTLETLSRLALATVSLAAKGEGAEMRTIAVEEERKPLIIDGESFNPVWTVKRYDDYITADGKKDSKAGGKALADGLNSLMVGDELQPNTDICVVVSDFLSGGRYDEQGVLTGFNWQQPLNRLQNELGDRLLVARLTTPAQRELPYARTFSYKGKPFGMDMDDYIKNSGQYAELAARKALLIAAALRGTRLLELDATDTKPLVTVPKFIFDKPLPITG